MQKPEYCPSEVYDAPPCGYEHCLLCTSKEIPQQCKILIESKCTVHNKEHIPKINLRQAIKMAIRDVERLEIELERLKKTEEINIGDNETKCVELHKSNNENIFNEITKILIDYKTNSLEEQNKHLLKLITLFEES